MLPIIQNETRVLLVDDFELVRTVLKRALNEIGMTRIDEARDGQGALEKIKDALGVDPYGLIFLDWNMPGLSGLEVLQMCRALPGLNHVPIVMVTAEADRKYIMKALMAGATDYIVKPCSHEILVGKIQHINANRKAV